VQSPQTLLEQILFTSVKGATRAEIRGWWLADTSWRELPHALMCMSPATAPFRQIEYKLMGELLYNVRLITMMAGDYTAYVTFAQQALAQVPSISEWTELSHPFSFEGARRRLEGRGDDKFKSAVSIGGRVPGVGKMSGTAVAFKRDGTQYYGFELYWFSPEPAGG
jgi:hypothetical protein